VRLDLEGLGFGVELEGALDSSASPTGGWGANPHRVGSTAASTGTGARLRPVVVGLGVEVDCCRVVIGLRRTDIPIVSPFLHHPSPSNQYSKNILFIFLKKNKMASNFQSVRKRRADDFRESNQESKRLRRGAGEDEESPPAKVGIKYYCSNDPFKLTCNPSAIPPSDRPDYKHSDRNLDVGFDNEEQCNFSCAKHIRGQSDALHESIQSIIREFVSTAEFQHELDMDNRGRTINAELVMPAIRGDHQEAMIMKLAFDDNHPDTIIDLLAHNKGLLYIDELIGNFTARLNTPQNTPGWNIRDILRVLEYIFRDRHLPSLISAHTLSNLIPVLSSRALNRYQDFYPLVIDIIKSGSISSLKQFELCLNSVAASYGNELRRMQIAELAAEIYPRLFLDPNSLNVFGNGINGIINYPDSKETDFLNRIIPDSTIRDRVSSIRNMVRRRKDILMQIVVGFGAIPHSIEIDKLDDLIRLSVSNLFVK